MRKIRALVAGSMLVLALAAPAQAWECQRSELCHGTVMTVCMTVAHVTGEHNCH